MQYRAFGRLGWLVSEIGYGMWGLAGWTGSDDDETSAALERAVELGCNFFDTAWAYGNGHSERLLGRLVRNHPEKELYVATKVPPKKLQMAVAARIHARRVFPSRSHPRIYREEPAESRSPPDRLAPVSCLGRSLGSRRALAARDRRPEARGADPARPASASIGGSRPT